MFSTVSANLGYPYARLVCAIYFVVSCAFVSGARATVVRFNTVYGNIDVRLYDSATPLTVANFLNYVNNGLYNGTFIHRSIPGFIIQGGGFTYTDQAGVGDVQQFAQVKNEPGISNLTGTIAMAKLADPSQGGPPNGGPNSATNQWFFNLSDNNASNLDNQNGGFTAFGRVVGTGMTAVNKIAALTPYDIDGPNATLFDDVPLRGTDEVPNPTSYEQILVYINSVQVLNYKAGDYDFNGTVNAADYSVWRSSFGSTTNAAADGNGDGKVDMRDYVIWRDTLGQSGGPGAGAGNLLDRSSVPEPSSAMLVSGLCLGCCRRLRRR
jgi:peptidyl-prolyl cis-trans isomerase A (cyclophilin A)